MFFCSFEAVDGLSIDLKTQQLQQTRFGILDWIKALESHHSCMLWYMLYHTVMGLKRG